MKKATVKQDRKLAHFGRLVSLRCTGQREASDSEQAVGAACWAITEVTQVTVLGSVNSKAEKAARERGREQAARERADSGG